MRTHAQIVEALMQRPGVRAEVERISREESDLLDSLLKARQDAGLSQADVAERMGTHAPAIARLERALATESISRRWPRCANTSKPAANGWCFKWPETQRLVGCVSEPAACPAQPCAYAFLGIRQGNISRTGSDTKQGFYCTLPRRLLGLNQPHKNTHLSGFRQSEKSTAPKMFTRSTEGDLARPGALAMHKVSTCPPKTRSY